MFPKSIRWRLQFWLAFLLMGLVCGFGITAYQLHRTTRLSQIDEELEQRVSALASAIRRPPPFGDRMRPPGFRPDGRQEDGENRRRRPGPDGTGHGPPSRQPVDPEFPFPGEGYDAVLADRDIQLPPSTLSLFEENDGRGFFYALWSRNGDVLRQSSNAPPNLVLPERARRDSGIQIRMRAGYREAFDMTELGEGVLAGRFVVDDLASIQRFAWWLVAAGLGVLALGLGGGWWLVTSAIRPVEAISASANRISAGNLAERIPITHQDTELGRLAGVLNTAFARLESAFTQQRQFTADASHELRTPIAVLISEAQTALSRERSADDYRETIEVCLEAAQQMRQLTQSLLALARYDSGHELLNYSRFDLADRLFACADRVRPLAQEYGIEIRCTAKSIELSADSERIDQVVTNLLTNAIHYNQDGGDVTVIARTTPGFALFEIADNGPGISGEDLPHVFERFFRADKSRTPTEGRSGLGLAICKAIVDAHGGQIEVSSQPGSGTTFSVSIPMPPEADRSLDQQASEQAGEDSHDLHK